MKFPYFIVDDFSKFFDDLSNRFNKSSERVARFASKEAEVRALIEGE